MSSESQAVGSQSAEPGAYAPGSLHLCRPYGEPKGGAGYPSRRTSGMGREPGQEPLRF